MTNLIGQSLGRYHILEQLGEGGMAIVYKAYDTRLETDVAVKVIRTESLPQNTVERALKRFEREAKALAKLNHQYIVKVMDYGEYDGKPYLVMPFFTGGTLKTKLGKPIPWQEAVEMLLPIAEALDYAHSQKMVHRDVKPANILLTDRGQPMLTDFGIAKVLDIEETMDLTGTSAAVGTPEYMAPEQVIAKIADHRADIYALGIVLYEMITGRKPYSADTPMAVLIMHARDPLPHPSKFVSGIPDSVEKVLIKSLAKSPDDRYQSMAEMVAALDGLSGRTKKQPSKVKKLRRIIKVKEATEKAARKKAKQGVTSQTIFLFVGFVAIVLVIALSSLDNNGVSSLPIPAPTRTSRSISPTATVLSKTPTLDSTPTKTPTQSITISIVPTQTSAPLPTAITDDFGIQMALVPAGTFTMGSEIDEDEKPIHEVYLDAYYMDVYEVTNVAYLLCVKDEVCDLPNDTSTKYNKPQYSNHPIVYIDWDKARVYCEWRSAHLPTEAEWEKAARGTDGRTYPWGDENPNCNNVNYGFDSCIGNTRPVGSYEIGKSPYGMYDMAGNVWEWVDDRYDAYPGGSIVSSSAYRGKKVIRGGSWKDDMTAISYLAITTTNRAAYDYYQHYGIRMTPDSIGFRCARDATP